MNFQIPRLPAVLRRAGRPSAAAALILTTVLVMRARADPVAVSGLGSTHHYKLALIELEGARAFSPALLRSVMTIQERPWYQIWKPLPSFSELTLKDDLAHIRRFYKAHAYYEVQTSYRLKVHRDAVAVVVKVHEGRPVRVAAVEIAVEGAGPAPEQLDPKFTLPLKKGDIFDQSVYQAAAQSLLNTYKSRAYALALVQRNATVELARLQATVLYRVTPGLPCVFGSSSINGLHKISPELVRRQLTYEAGQPFDQRKLEASRAALLSLNLFDSVDIHSSDNPGDRTVVPIVISLSEGPKHTINAGFGYNTQTQFNAMLGWDDNNFLGGGRRLSITGTYSNVTSVFDAKLLQPDFFLPPASLTLEVSGQQQSYQTYTGYISGFDPHIDYHFSPSLTAALGWRLEYLKFNSVNPSTIAAIGGFRDNGLLSGPFTSLTFNNTEDPFNPQSGERLGLVANISSHSFGADYSYWRVLGDARKYVSVGWRTVLAGRVSVGLEDALDRISDLPLSERFYSGGEGSVRGYGLRRIGPLSLSNDPLGGLSVIETSLELRRPLFWKFTGAAFFDCGQVAAKSFDLRVDALQCGYGPAIGMDSPVGPIHVYLGFPTQRPRGDSSWQVYFSIGQYF